MFLELLRYFSMAILLLAGVWSIFRFRNLQTKVGRYFIVYLWFKCVFEIISGITSLLSINNLPWFYLYCALELIIVTETVFVLSYMQTLVAFKRPLQFFLLAAIVGESLYVWKQQVNAVSRLTECIVLTLLCIIAYIRMIYSPYLSHFFKIPDFWFLISTMICLAAHAFIVKYINYSLNHLGIAFSRQLWLFNYVTIGLSNLLLIAGIWVASKRFTSNK